MTVTRQMTAVDFARLGTRAERFELIRGELREMSPVGSEHGRVLVRCALYFGSFVLDNGLGELYGGDPGVILEHDPATVRAPDLAFVSAERLPLPPTESSFMDLIPDAIIEIASPFDSSRALDEKIADFLSRGTRVALTFNPRPRTVSIFRLGHPPITLSESDDLVIEDVFPGFRIRVRKFFE
ncbi:MAG TPA: Uma2 family endonuclease [Thermomicrobiales bacterium]